ncbi:MAG: DUF5672 family protein [Candidatus Pacearchaeota archaeon]
MSILKRNVAIVVPVHKYKFNNDEKISINQLKKLKGYHFYLAIPVKYKNKKFKEFTNFKKICFGNNFFESYKGYNKLLKSKIFYLEFKKYKYILIYQTDCLVFKNNLLKFCKKNYDYIGAPIFQYNRKGKICGVFVGNGGLSLRKVESFLKVLDERNKLLKRLLWILTHLLLLPKKTLTYLLASKPRAISHLFTINEDMFWSLEAKKFYPQFKIAPFKEACKFAIEMEIEKCLKINKNKLPFGCHAFQKYKNFWLKKLK